MTTFELSSVVQAHACVIAGRTPRFRVGMTAEPLAEPAAPRVLVQVDVAVLPVMAPLRQPAQVPLLSGDAPRERHRPPCQPLGTSSTGSGTNAP